MEEGKSNDMLCVNTVRMLACDMVRKANSGHPGMPMGMAPIAHVLWKDVMSFCPSAPDFANRDRFVLSNGHGCALLYSMLHLTGYDLPMEQLKLFRQLKSKTPGHPEYGHTVGVEATTGPLGQGIANAVGMAIAERSLAARFNKDGFKMFDHNIYVFCGDGCLQEGISSEASSLAGHLGLGKIVIMYDDNSITIDGSTDLSFTENVLARYDAYGWHTQQVVKGDDGLDEIGAAILAAKAETGRPSIIAIKTIIGYGSKNEGEESTHGSPLAPDDIANTKKKLGLNPEEHFQVSKSVYETYANAAKRGTEDKAAWDAMLDKYCKTHSDMGEQLQRFLRKALPFGWKKALPSYSVDSKADATRNISGAILNALAPVIPELIGGSADLAPSNKTLLKCSGDFQKATPQGRNLRFGVREHAMAAIGNGINASGLLPYTATFLNFIEYCFPAVRIAALSQHQQLFIMTHDSIGLGEDGPTHQPIEALALCRSTPNVLLMRPADGNETVGCYQVAITNRTGPSVLCLTRQNLPHLASSHAEKVSLGGYVCQDATDHDVILIGSGSEVSLCMGAAGLLTEAGFKVRVVSMPCVELFDVQSVKYRQSIITPNVMTFAVEMASPNGWERYSHHCIGMSTFGGSAPMKDLFKHFGFTPSQVAARVQTVIKDRQEVAKQLSGAAVGLLGTHFQSMKSKI